MLRLGALALLLLGAPASAAKPLPPSPSEYIYNESVVSAAEAAELSHRLRELENKTGHQFVVALFQSLDGESLEDYSNRLFRAWAPGSKKDNDGLLFCLFLKERRWRVEVGYGLEPVITDLEAAEYARAGIPYFKNGDYGGGVRAVVEGLAQRLESGKPAARPSAGGFNPSVWIVLIALLWFFINSLRLRPTIGRRGRYYGGGWGGGGGGDWGGGGGWTGGGGDGGGFSGGGGSSGGGGASGGW